jgi:hypothetical protein
MKITGEAQRTISSTAVGVTPSRSSSQIRRWSGFSLSSCRPQLIALRVVSLPATTSRMKNEASSSGVSRSPSISALTSCRGDVVGRVLPPVAAEVLHQLGEPRCRLQQRVMMSRPVRHVLRVPGPRMMFDRSEDEVVLAGRHAHHVADDRQRQPRGDRRDRVALALLDDVVDDLGATRCTSSVSRASGGG